MSEQGLDPKISRINGVTYLEIPSADLVKSSNFYRSVFEWKMEGDQGSGTFSDGTGHVIGHFIPRKPSSVEKGIVPYVYVKSVKSSIERIIAAGGEVVKSPFKEGNLTVSTFLDTSGNIVGIWQEGHI